MTKDSFSLAPLPLSFSFPPFSTGSPPAPFFLVVHRLPSSGEWNSTRRACPFPALMCLPFPPPALSTSSSFPGALSTVGPCLANGDFFRNLEVFRGPIRPFAYDLSPRSILGTEKPRRKRTAPSSSSIRSSSGRHSAWTALCFFFFPVDVNGWPLSFCDGGTIILSSPLFLLELAPSLFSFSRLPETREIMPFLFFPPPRARAVRTWSPFPFLAKGVCSKKLASGSCANPSFFLTSREWRHHLFPYLFSAGG